MSTSDDGVASSKGIAAVKSDSKSSAEDNKPIKEEVGVSSDTVKGVAEARPASESSAEDSKSIKEEVGVSSDTVFENTPVKEAGTDIQGDQGELNNQQVVKMAVYNRCYEPPAFISETKTYSTYKYDLKMWSRITSVPKASQAEVVVYGLEGHPTGIKEKIIVSIGDSLENAENGIDLLITFLDGIYQEDDMSAAWTKYKNFNKISRGDGVAVNDFIAEFEKEYLLAKSAGCEYSDIILAFRLLEGSRLSETDEKFVLTGVDYPEAKTKKNFFDQLKLSLKKFQGRKMVSSVEETKVTYDPALVASVAQVLVSQGWKKTWETGTEAI